MKIIRLEVLSYFWEKVKNYITTELPIIYKFKGSKQTYAELLEITDAVVGDVWNIINADVEHDINAGDNLAWTGTVWDNLRGYIDLSNYYKKGEIDEKYNDIIEKLKKLQKELEEKFKQAEVDITSAREYSEQIVKELNDELSNDIVENINTVNKRIDDTKTDLAQTRIDLSTAKNELNNTINTHYEELTATKEDLNNTKEDLTNTKTNLENEINNANDRINNANDEIDKAKERISSTETSIGTININLDETNARINANTEYIDKESERINNINVDLDGVHASINANVSSINTINSSIITVGERLDAIDGTIELYGNKINANENTISSVSLKLDTAEASIEANTSYINTVSGDLTTAKSEINSKFGTIEDRVSKLDGESGAIVELTRKIDANKQTITDEIDSLTGDNGKVTKLISQMDGINETITNQILSNLNDENSDITLKIGTQIDAKNETIVTEINKSIKNSEETIKQWVGTEYDGENGKIRTAIDKQIEDNNKNYTTTESLNVTLDSLNKTITTAYESYVADNISGLATEKWVGTQINGAKGTIETAYKQYTDDKTKDIATTTWVGQQIDGENGIIKTAYEKYVDDKTSNMATTSYVGQQINGVKGNITTAVTEEIEKQGVITTTNLSTELDKEKGTIKTIASELIQDPDTGTTYDFSEIKQNKQNITLAVASATSANDGVADINKFLGERGENDTLADKIAAISITDDQIASVVANNLTAATIIQKINDDTSEIAIKADKIVLVGDTIAQALTASKASISDINVINANVTGTINATSGNFGNLYIDGEKVYAGKGGSGSGGTDNSSTWIDENGILTCNGAIIEGDITATTGHFGNLYINGNQVYAGKEGSGSGGVDSSNSYFDENGILHCKGAQISGNVSADTFVTNMNKFKVSNDGILTAVDAILDGTLAAKEITTTSGNFKVNTSGILTATNAKISGEITASKLTITDDSFMNKLIVRKVATADTGKRVVVADNTMLMYDSNNNIKMKVSGDVIAESRESSKVYYDTSPFNKSIPLSSVSDGQYDFDSQVVQTITVTSYAGSVISFPQLTADIGFYCNDTSTADTVYIYGELSIEVDGVKDVCYYEIDTTIDGNGISTISLSRYGSAEYSLGEGTHTIKVYCEYHISNIDVNNMSDISSAISLKNQPYCEVYYPAELVEVGSNGFRAGFGSDYKAEFIKDTSTNKVSFVIKAGSYALKISDSGIQKSTNGGSSWTNL